jgi:hypothetical protein
MPIVGQFGSLAGFGMFPGGSFESIATVTVGSGGASSVSFSNIPSTYQHLQIRAICRTNRASYVVDNITIRLNSDSGSNYAAHELWGGYTSTPETGAAGYASNSSMDIGRAVTTSVAGTSTFSAVVLDLLDYANTSKNKTVRMSSGFDMNGTGGTGSYGGTVNLKSGLWMSTSAVTAISFTPQTGSQITQHSTFALYGVRA